MRWTAQAYACRRASPPARGSKIVSEASRIARLIGALANAGATLEGIKVTLREKYPDLDDAEQSRWLAIARDEIQMTSEPGSEILLDVLKRRRKLRHAVEERGYKLVFTLHSSLILDAEGRELAEPGSLDGLEAWLANQPKPGK
jgi:hypothetical protein